MWFSLHLVQKISVFPCQNVITDDSLSSLEYTFARNAPGTTFCLTVAFLEGRFTV